MKTQIEEFRDIPGYKNSYQVSNFGNVGSFKNNRWGVSDKINILKPQINSNGYYSVRLYKEGKGKTFQVHQLVCIAFKNHVPSGMNLVVNHKDKNQLNNRFDNLELVSNRYNLSCHKTDVGVSLQNNNKYRAAIQINNKTVNLGSFIEKEDALAMYQKALANKHLYDGNNKEFREMLGYNYKPKGFTLRPNGKYETTIKINYKLISLGTYKNEQDAANQYQKALANINKYNGNDKEFREMLGYNYKPKGYILKPNGKYETRIKINDKLISLGTYENEQDAAKQYEKALANINKYNGDNKKFRELLATDNATTT